MIVYIEWIDSSGVDGWINEDDYTPELQTIDSIGYLVDETDEHITICAHKTSTGIIGSPITIPKRCIIEQTQIHG